MHTEVIPETHPHTKYDEIPRSREAWANNLIERLQYRKAIAVLDAREQPLPDHITNRLTKDDITSLEQFQSTLFGQDWKEHLKGKTFAVAYMKFGHGHKHQATDLAILLAHTLHARVVLFDPMDALPDRERNLMLLKKNLHKALQTRDEAFLATLKGQLNDGADTRWWKRTVDKIPAYESYMLAEMAIHNMPATTETGNRPTRKPSWATQKFTDLVQSHPRPIVRAFALAETEATERSVATATATIAAMYDAEAILTTHNGAVRALTPDILEIYVPHALRQKAKKAVGTIITITPDNGYTKRKPGPAENGPLTQSELVEDLAIASPHAFLLRSSAPWLKNTMHVVADDVVAERFSTYWRVPKEEYFPFGTVADSVSPKQFIEKWSQPVRRILIASNGNGSNLIDAIRAMEEIGELSPTWLADHGLHLDIFAADLPNKVPQLLAAAHKAGLSDQVEVIDFTNEYFNKGREFAYSNDPEKRIHIAYGTGDMAGSDLKQYMQRAAHVEIRSPGENALTGANVGTLELGTPPGGPNEIYNMAWAARNKLSYPINWGAILDAPPWQTAGFTTELGLIDDGLSKSFPILITYLLENRRMDQLARTAYQHANKQTSYAVVGLLTGELLRIKGQPVPDRETIKQMYIRYMQARNEAIAGELPS